MVECVGQILNVKMALYILIFIDLKFSRNSIIWQVIKGPPLFSACHFYSVASWNLSISKTTKGL